MRLGVDFDNTLVRYDELFHKVCLERDLIPPDLPPIKTTIRNHLRKAGREDAWTEIQGVVYGPRLGDAAAFEGALEFLRDALAAGHEVSIISHKTRYPYRGERHDLHAAARAWLESQGVVDPARIGLPPENAFFDGHKEAKLARITQRRCDWFIDDLPEILTHDDFPPGVNAALFDPADVHPDDPRWFRARSWADLSTRLLSVS